ncbi:protein ROOT INITIATION DEFECTIVE 3-like [Argentina anserina]|uniref:protein ROOT INITIATION DEFECTIVE 3-like n=1 Tax=Argentina anserina TaxID=57926 RepID=UPI0021768324|nr:protein ROOT INITIATION DEFECTIVE 3-like [Potentilla anserina]
MGCNGGEAVAVCSDKSMGIGITIWDIDTGDRLLHIPSCASPPRGLLCLRNQFIFASQIHRPGSVGGGVISMWPLNKPQQPLWSYPLEAIVSIACTKDGVYFAGGAPSGNAYVWEVNSGKMLKTWPAHCNSVNCMLFSDDGSLLISGTDNGMISVWSLISLLDVEDYQSFPSLLNYSMDHKSSITGLSATSGSSRLILVSSSLDGSCKVRDIGLGTLLQTQIYPTAITALVLNPTEQLFYSGSIDGRIFVNQLEIGLVENDPLFPSEDQAVVLKGHKGSITAMTFCQSGLVSASEDCTICIWDANTGTIIRRFNHQKGAVTNLAVIPRSSLLPGSSQRRGLGLSLLEKYPQPANLFRQDTRITLASPCQVLNENQTAINFQTTHSCQHMYDMEKKYTPASMEIKLEQSLAERTWATTMANHVMDMNRHLQSQLLDLMQSRFLLSKSTEMDSPPTKKRKISMSESPQLQEVEHP